MLGDEIGEENVLIFSSYTNRRNANIFRGINNVSNEIYNLREAELGLPPERANLPVIFFSDSTLIARMVFVPTKEISSLSESYYSAVRFRFTQ